MVNAENFSAGIAASRDPVVVTSTSTSTSTNNKTDSLIGGLIDLKSSLRLTPKSPDKCPVFAVFYAEFDIKKGPVVRYQSPKNFLDRDINTTTAEIHEILEKTFERLKVEENNANTNATSNRKHQEVPRDDDDGDVEATCTDDDDVEVVLNSSPKNSKKSIGETVSSTKQRTTKDEQEQHQLSSTSTAELQSSSNDMQHEEEDSSIVHIIEKNNDDGDGDTITLGDEVSSDDEVNLPEGGQSIFDSTSEYIITGSELTGKIITLSTHDVHVMTRPTQITNERYERNSLLFSIGMVLRRAADPRPFRPLISKLAMTLRSMEIESGILSDPIKVRRTIQPLLERILISMNSPRWECNLLLDRSTSLNLKLFHPPKPPASPVHNYQVPVLLVRDFQLGYYEWDLAINWVILHIDGITNARQISVKAEVDLEMVLACLRVLKHHGVISVVDMFLYTNRYECTERAAAMLTGKEDKLLQEAIDFTVKRPQQQAVHFVPPPVPSPRTVPTATTVSSGGGNNTAGSPKSGTSPYLGSIPSSSYPPRSLNLFGGGGISQRSNNFRHMMTASSIERDQASFLEGAHRHLEDRRNLKAALAELYCGCNRNLSFGDLWLSLTTELPNSLIVPNLNNKIAPVHRGSGLSSNYQRTRKDSLTEYDMSENEVVTFSPMESSYLESLRYRSSSVTDEHKNTTGKIPSSSLPIDWNEIFKEFDHRRFITFGVVNGLLIRVHSYPFFLGPFPERRRYSASLVLPPESTRLHVNKNTIDEKNFHFAKAVANMMDGTRFDDELVCTFERPFNQLVELVEKYSGKKVVHIFA